LQFEPADLMGRCMSCRLGAQIILCAIQVVTYCFAMLEIMLFVYWNYNRK